MNYNELAKKHYEWVERMNWHNKTILESIALIQSEVGEAIDEFIGLQKPSENFGEELSDIALRMLDVGETNNLDTDYLIKMAIPRLRWRGTSLEGDMCELISDIAKWSNTVRYDEYTPVFSVYYGAIMARIVDIAERNYVNLTDEIIKKLEKNEVRGTRGRTI